MADVLRGRRYLLDYIMVKQGYKNTLKNAHTLPEADNDHNLIIIKIDFRLKTIRKRMLKLKKQWNGEDFTKMGSSWL